MNSINQQTFIPAVRAWLTSKGVHVTAEGPFTIEEMEQLRGLLTFEYGIRAEVVTEALYLPGMFSPELLNEIMESYDVGVSEAVVETSPVEEAPAAPVVEATPVVEEPVTEEAPVADPVPANPVVEEPVTEEAPVAEGQ